MKDKIHKREILYLHLQKRKMKNFVFDVKNNFLCVPNRFIEYADENQIIKKCKLYIGDFIKSAFDNKKIYLSRIKRKIKSCFFRK